MMKETNEITKKWFIVFACRKVLANKAPVDGTGAVPDKSQAQLEMKQLQNQFKKHQTLPSALPAVVKSLYMAMLKMS